MSTFTLTASKCAYVQTAKSSAWNSTGAKQGVYEAGGTPRVGAILFNGLRSIDWRGQNISRITLDFTWGRSGTSARKTIGLNRGTQTAIIGTGAEMLGERIGEFVTSGRAYGSETTDTFDASTNPGTFAGLVGWLQQSDSPILVLYMDEENPNFTWSKNYASASALTITIEYEPAGSGGGLDNMRVEAGGTVTLTIIPLQADGAVTHSVAWKLGQAISDSEFLGDILTSSFTVPMDWLYQLPNATVGAAQCLLTTYVDGTESATRAIPFYVSVPANVVPDFDPVIEPYLTTGNYYALLGGASIHADNARSYYGATITAYRIAGAEDVLAAVDTVNTPIFRTSGEHRYTLTVTDSRGRTTVKEISIDVLTVGKPRIESFSVRRYAATVNDEGETIYTDSFVGNHVWISLNASIDTAGGNNTPTAYIEYGGVQIPLAWDTGAATITRVDDRGIITALVPLNSAYSFTLYVSDRLNEVTAGARVEKSTSILHLAGSGFGAAFGGFSTATESAPEVRTYWPLFGSDGFQIDGYMEEKITEFGPNFESYSDLRHPYVMRAGRIVTLTGSCKPTANIAGSATLYPMFTLPEKFRPVHPINVVCQGSTYYQWTLQINTAGVVEFSRYRAGTSYAAANTTAMLTFHTSWIAADLPEPEPDPGNTDLAYFTYPEYPMTSNSSQGCVASASSTTSGYPVYQAFDNEESKSWASASDSDDQWIQLKMPQALKRITVEVHSRTSSNIANPIAGQVLGSNDGSTWTPIGSYSGWSKTQRGGKLGEIVCNNDTAYSYVRLTVTDRSYDGHDYVAIGYITITGGVPAE